MRSTERIEFFVYFQKKSNAEERRMKRKNVNKSDINIVFPKKRTYTKRKVAINQRNRVLSFLVFILFIFRLFFKKFTMHTSQSKSPFCDLLFWETKTNISLFRKQNSNTTSCWYVRQNYIYHHHNRDTEKHSYHSPHLSPKQKRKYNHEWREVELISLKSRLKKISKKELY